jgi:2-hydroxy-6-oxonona-2,4-dienedioate hydrolase/2-hydroxy-6-oxo-6-(2'-carboxyphenyl)-hexa-2,4-dienoate hydrolase
MPDADVQYFELSRPVTCKPLSEWKSVTVELLGTQTRFVQGAKWRHRVIEAGTGGEPLFLLHGVGGHAETYARNMHRLADAGFHVFSLDMLHHGLTDKEPWEDEFLYEQYAESLVDLADALGFERVHIEGESLGALVAFVFGHLYPERSGKIILNTGIPNLKDVNAADFPSAVTGTADLTALSRGSVEEPEKFMAERMKWLVAEPDRMTEEMIDVRTRLYEIPEVNAAMRQVYLLDHDPSQPWPKFAAPRWGTEDLAAFQPETLVFWTDHNPTQSAALAKFATSKIPGAKFYNMADASHWPQWEKPEEHDQVLIEFILGA